MDNNRLPKTNLKYKPEGRRNIGSPQTKWEMFPGGRNSPKGVSLIDDDGDDDYDDYYYYYHHHLYR